MIHTKHPAEMIPIKPDIRVYQGDKLQCTANPVSVVTPVQDSSDKNAH